MSSGVEGTKREAKEEKLARLRNAIENYQPGGFFDEEEEQAKATVRESALSLLDYRARSRHELQGRLLDKEYDPAVVTAVLDDLQEAGLIDDAAFAQEWVRQRSRRRGKSTRVLAQELREKGVEAQDRQEALAQISQEEERATAWACACKKARSIKEVPADYPGKQKDLRRVVGVLARRGFPEGMSLALAREAVEERYRELGG
ncbi:MULTISPECIES: recombination regulator RecX [unclassified Corynebacterium]|uniref:recombination regulator RecX n=1 Tax=unclassified Corynebacterium TaxID=2624378 RepID=UPI0029CA7CE8|nr:MULTISPECIES: recombination regulator RecX [unclassified Corynebacterium]WPF65266.1 recombination regulator RecX [Corynebacterium sp. 22KM0430]WPF67761.1 recombination regulator RecX [Corynebacterium sp. 21KM1197]